VRIDAILKFVRVCTYIYVWTRTRTYALRVYVDAYI